MADLIHLPRSLKFVMNTMSRRGEKLPGDWDEGAFCMNASIGLAAYIDRADWRLLHEDREKLLDVGGILIRSVYHQVEAGNLADQIMDRLRGGGAA